MSAGSTCPAVAAADDIELAVRDQWSAATALPVNGAERRSRMGLSGVQPAVRTDDEGRSPGDLQDHQTGVSETGVSETGVNQSSNNSAAAVRLRTVLGLLAVCELLLLSVTAPLWHGGTAFPQVPLLAVASHLPRNLQAVLGSLFVAGLLLLVLSGLVPQRWTGWQRWLRGGTAVCGLGLVVLNQHCLQAWHWFCLLCLLHGACLPPGAALVGVRTAVVAVYVFSALSRITPDIGESMTGQIAGQLLRQSGLRLAAASPEFVTVTAWLFTVGELVTGLLVACPRARRPGAVLSVLLHSLLLVALGPLGLGHHHGVLLWNLQFICLVPLLLSRLPGAESAAGVLPSPQQLVCWSGPVRVRCAAACGLTILLPLSGLWGIWDNWPSWQLYSPRPEIWKLYVRNDAVPQLPEAVHPFVGPAAPLSDWRPVRIDRWSLAATGAPLYPEDRFQLAVIEWLTRDVTAADAIRVDIDAPQRFCWWQRTQTVLEGRSELQALQTRSLLPAVVR